MKTFDKEYKLMAVKRVKASGKSVSEVAICCSADEELRKLRKKILGLKWKMRS